MLAPFMLAIFLGAFLLFSVQPMAAKMILPLLGGSPAVWNATMLFFQGLLLAGYLYAHAIGRVASARRQTIVHAVLMAASATALPIALPAGERWLSAAEHAPAYSALALLALAVGAPAFILCTASPLLQQWFTHTGHSSASRPYFLYAASNAGSLAGLLCYPFLIEPNLTLTAQRFAWTGAFGAFAALALACGVIAARSTRPPKKPPERSPEKPPERSPEAEAEESSTKPRIAEPRTPDDSLAPTTRRLLWIALAFVPASLFMGATQYLTTDVASAPFLWVPPLSIYLLTYIVAFSRGGERVGAWCNAAMPLAVAAVAAMFVAEVRAPLMLVMGAHLTLLALAAGMCHGRLASLRPHPSRLTEYYLLLAAGGVLAGLFNTLLAPAVFDTVAEYPLMIAAACLLRTPMQGAIPPAGMRPTTRLWLEVLWWIPAVLVLPAYATFQSGLLGTGAIGVESRLVLLAAVPAILALSLMLFRVRFAVAAALMLAVPWIHEPESKDTLLTVRTFFGVHRVVRTTLGVREFHELHHGRTLHGLQRVDNGHRFQPVSYYAPGSPYSDVIHMMYQRPRFERMAVLGLGTGALAAYGRVGLDITFFEIDPQVVAIARTPAFFTFLTDTPSKVNIVLGDARLSLARSSDDFDLICLDAFTSDAIPTHLITREALAVYLSRLRPGGVIAWHISNVFLDLEPVVARLAEDAGLVALSRDEEVSRQQEAEGRSSSHLVALARTWDDLTPLRRRPGWTPIRSPGNARLWTDDYCDLVSALLWTHGE